VSDPDYIVVGAGSAGCVLAHRLSEDPTCQVLLLEAGGRDLDLNIHIPAASSRLHGSSVDYKLWTEPQRECSGRRIYIPRGKVAN
jgi:choline dehydrogenase